MVEDPSCSSSPAASPLSSCPLDHDVGGDGLGQGRRRRRRCGPVVVGMDLIPTNSNKRFKCTRTTRSAVATMSLAPSTTSWGNEESEDERRRIATSSGPQSTRESDNRLEEDRQLTVIKRGVGGLGVGIVLGRDSTDEVGEEEQPKTPILHPKTHLKDFPISHLRPPFPLVPFNHQTMTTMTSSPTRGGKVSTNTPCDHPNQQPIISSSCCTLNNQYHTITSNILLPVGKRLSRKKLPLFPSSSIPIQPRSPPLPPPIPDPFYPFKGTTTSPPDLPVVTSTMSPLLFTSTPPPLLRGIHLSDDNACLENHHLPIPHDHHVITPAPPLAKTPFAPPAPSQSAEDKRKYMATMKYILRRYKDQTNSKRAEVLPGCTFHPSDGVFEVLQRFSKVEPRNVPTSLKKTVADCDLEGSYLRLMKAKQTLLPPPTQSAFVKFVNKYAPDCTARKTGGDRTTSAGCCNDSTGSGAINAASPSSNDILTRNKKRRFPPLTTSPHASTPLPSNNFHSSLASPFSPPVNPFRNPGEDPGGPPIVPGATPRTSSGALATVGNAFMRTTNFVNTSSTNSCGIGGLLPPPPPLFLSPTDSSSIPFFSSSSSSPLLALPSFVDPPLRSSPLSSPSAASMNNSHVSGSFIFAFTSRAAAELARLRDADRSPLAPPFVFAPYSEEALAALLGAAGVERFGYFYHPPPLPPPPPNTPTASSEPPNARETAPGSVIIPLNLSKLFGSEDGLHASCDVAVKENTSPNGAAERNSCGSGPNHDKSMKGGARTRSGNNDGVWSGLGAKSWRGNVVGGICKITSGAGPTSVFLRQLEQRIEILKADTKYRKQAIATKEGRLQELWDLSTNVSCYYFQVLMERALYERHNCTLQLNLLEQRLGRRNAHEEAERRARQVRAEFEEKFARLHRHYSSILASMQRSLAPALPPAQSHIPQHPAQQTAPYSVPLSCDALTGSIFTLHQRQHSNHGLLPAPFPDSAAAAASHSQNPISRLRGSVDESNAKNKNVMRGGKDEEEMLRALESTSMIKERKDAQTMDEEVKDERNQQKKCIFSRKKRGGDQEQEEEFNHYSEHAATQMSELRRLQACMATSSSVRLPAQQSTARWGGAGGGLVDDGGSVPPSDCSSNSSSNSFASYMKMFRQEDATAAASYKVLLPKVLTIFLDEEVPAALSWLTPGKPGEHVPPSHDSYRDGTDFAQLAYIESQFLCLLEQAVEELYTPEVGSSSDANCAQPASATHALRRAQILSANSCLYEQKSQLDRERAVLAKKQKLHLAMLNSQFNDFPMLQKGYRLLNMIGMGGFAEVWEAFDPYELEIYAAKLHILTSAMGQAQRSEVVKRVANEIAIHRDINWHPHIVNMACCFEISHELLVTILDRCDDDLDQYLKKHGAIPQQLALAWTKQILDALKFMKNGSHGCVHHCDLKPGNILIRGGSVKLADFGLSKRIEPGEAPPVFSGAGTACYQAPECFDSSKQPLFISDKLDVWAVGCILFEMLYMKRLFSITLPKDQLQMKANRDRLLESMRQPVRFAPTRGESVVPQLESLINAMLAYEPKERPSIEDLLEHPALTMTI